MTFDQLTLDNGPLGVMTSSIGSGTEQCNNQTHGPGFAVTLHVQCTDIKTGTILPAKLTAHVFVRHLFHADLGYTGFVQVHPVGGIGGSLTVRNVSNSSISGAVSATRLGKGLYTVTFTKAGVPHQKLSMVRAFHGTDAARCNSSVTSGGGQAVVTVKCWNKLQQLADPTFFDLVYFGVKPVA